MKTATTPAVKERGILFKDRLVRAILDGKKTQTRRIVMSKARNMQASGQVCVRRNPDNDPWYRKHVWSVRQAGGIWGDFTHEEMLAQCPYGKPGDRLWVREAWRCFGGREYEYQREQKSIIYRATKDLIDSGPWRPSIFMPRWASRITLEITRVRVERLQAITDEDAVAEGVSPRTTNILYADEPLSEQLPHLVFKGLWDAVNAKRGFGWAANPWVWVLEFRRVT